MCHRYFEQNDILRNKTFCYRKWNTIVKSHGLVVDVSNIVSLYNKSQILIFIYIYFLRMINGLGLNNHKLKFFEPLLATRNDHNDDNIQYLFSVSSKVHEQSSFHVFPKLRLAGILNNNWRICNHSPNTKVYVTPFPWFVCILHTWRIPGIIHIGQIWPTITIAIGISWVRLKKNLKQQIILQGSKEMNVYDK